MKKNIVIACLVGIIIGLIIALAVVCIKENKKKDYDLGEVIKSENDYIIIKGNNTTQKIESTSLTVGDIIKQENNTTMVIKVPETTTQSVNENDIKTYFVGTYENVKNGSLKNNLKETFVTIVDFVFYDGEISGVHFSSLSNSAKLTILKYTLLIDSEIEKLIPNYKETIGDGYKNIKEKLIGEYMNSLSYVCSKNKDECAKFKLEFNELKEKVSITWVNIKDAFKMYANKTKNSLEEWYKIFKNS